jgi:hypothetical protein
MASTTNPLAAYVTTAAAGASSGVDQALVDASTGPAYAYTSGQDNALIEQTENLALPYGEQIFSPIYNYNDIPAGESTAVTDAFSSLVGPGVYIDPALYNNPAAAAADTSAVTPLDLTPVLLIVGAVFLVQSLSSPSKGRKGA